MIQKQQKKLQQKQIQKLLGTTKGSRIDPQSAEAQDLADDKKETVLSTDNTVEGSASTDPQTADESAEKATEDIRKSISNDDSNIEKDVNNGLEIKFESDYVVVTGDDDTGSNKNSVEEEKGDETPFTETTEIKSNEIPEVPAGIENEQEDEGTEETPSYDEVSEMTFDETEEDTKASSIASDDEESTEEDILVLTSEVAGETATFTASETEKNDEESAIDTASDNLKTSAQAEEAAEDEAIIINDSFVKADKNGIATIVVDEGKISSADAGEGVNVNVSGNTITVSLQTPEETMVDLDVVDTLGNVTTVVVAFN